MVIKKFTSWGWLKCKNANKNYFHFEYLLYDIFSSERLINFGTRRNLKPRINTWDKKSYKHTYMMRLFLSAVCLAPSARSACIVSRVRMLVAGAGAPRVIPGTKKTFLFK